MGREVLQLVEAISSNLWLFTSIHKQKSVNRSPEKPGGGGDHKSSLLLSSPAVCATNSRIYFFEQTRQNAKIGGKFQISCEIMRPFQSGLPKRCGWRKLLHTPPTKKKNNFTVTSPFGLSRSHYFTSGKCLDATT